MMSYTIIPGHEKMVVKYSRDETEVEAENAAVVAVYVPTNPAQYESGTPYALLGDGRRVVLDEDCWIESDTSVIIAQVSLEELVG